MKTFVIVLLIQLMLCAPKNLLAMQQTIESADTLRIGFQWIPDLEKRAIVEISWNSSEPVDSIIIWLYKRDKMILQLGKIKGTNTKKWKVPNKIESGKYYHLRGLVNNKMIASNLFKIKGQTIDELEFISKKFVEDEKLVFQYSSDQSLTDSIPFRFMEIQQLTRGDTNRVYWESKENIDSVMFWLFRNETKITWLKDFDTRKGSSRLYIPSTVSPGKDYYLRSFTQSKVFESNSFVIESSPANKRASKIILIALMSATIPIATYYTIMSGLGLTSSIAFDTSFPGSWLEGNPFDISISF